MFVMQMDFCCKIVKIFAHYFNFSAMRTNQMQKKEKKHLICCRFIVISNAKSSNLIINICWLVWDFGSFGGNSIKTQNKFLWCGKKVSNQIDFSHHSDGKWTKFHQWILKWIEIKNKNKNDEGKKQRTARQANQIESKIGHNERIVIFRLVIWLLEIIIEMWLRTAPIRYCQMTKNTKFQLEWSCKNRTWTQ